MSQHASLGAERWRSFTLDQQLLMIANEMNRASKLLTPEDAQSLNRAYQRVLRLTDLTIEVQERPALRRELLLWRDLVAQLRREGIGNPRAHSAALRSLLLFTLVTDAQLAHISLPDSLEVEEPS